MANHKVLIDSKQLDDFDEIIKLKFWAGEDKLIYVAAFDQNDNQISHDYNSKVEYADGFMDSFNKSLIDGLKDIIITDLNTNPDLHLTKKIT